MSKKITIDEIMNDDDFGLLDITPKESNVKTDNDRLIDIFKEINEFVDKNNREPGKKTMSEYSLYSKLSKIKEDMDKMKQLKPFDKHNILGEVEADSIDIEDIFKDDNFGLLDLDNEMSIFDLKNIPKVDERNKADEISKRKKLSEDEFIPYEKMFQQVHEDLKTGKRKIRPFHNAEKNLHEGNYYLLDGLILYLETADIKRQVFDLKSGNRTRNDGRTKTIFENAKYSDMLYRSLGKQLVRNGKLITNTFENIEKGLNTSSLSITKEDEETGYIYVLKSNSMNPKISSIKDLYKIGFTSVSVKDRIKNAKNEATYLFDDVKVVATYNCFNRKADKLERLLHRFFAKVCLNIDLYDSDNKRYNPREWFIVPFEVIDEVIKLIINENIVNYTYDEKTQKIILI